MNDELKTKLLVMQQGETFKNKEGLEDSIIISYGFLKIKGKWIKVFR